MPRRHRRRAGAADPWAAAVLALDDKARVGWAKFYSAEERSAQLSTLCEAYRDRVDVLVEELLHLVDCVLHERNVSAFSEAWRIQSIVETFENGRPA